jgi:hypothetical protein
MLFRQVQRTSLRGKEVMSLMSAIQKSEKTESKRGTGRAFLIEEATTCFYIKYPLKRTDQTRKHEKRKEFAVL